MFLGTCLGDGADGKDWEIRVGDGLLPQGLRKWVIYQSQVRNQGTEHKGVIGREIELKEPV